MKSQICFAAALLLGMAGVARADAKDEVRAAAQKLADSANYSWTKSVKNIAEEGQDYGGGGGNYGGGTVHGATEKGGLTTLELVWPNETYEVIVGSNHSILKHGFDWIADVDLYPPGFTPMGGNGGSFGRLSQEQFLIVNLDTRTPSKLALDLIEDASILQKSGDWYTSDASKSTVESALNFLVEESPEYKRTQINDPAGSVSFSLQDGVLSALELHLTGTMIFERSHKIDRIIKFEIFDIGKTKLDVPDAAKAKLEKIEKKYSGK